MGPTPTPPAPSGGGVAPPGPRPDGPVPPGLLPEDRAVLHVAVRAMQERLDEVVQAVGIAILRDHPDLVDPRDDAALAAVRDASRANVGAILSTLAFEVSPHGMDVPEGALALLDHVAVEPSALPAMLRAYRLGAAAYEQLWVAQVEATTTDAATLGRVVRHAMRHTAVYVDRISAVIAERWEDVVAAAARAGRRRDAALRSLAAGTVVDAELLGHPTDLPQLVVAVRPAATGATPRRVRDLLDRPRGAATELPDGTVVGWLAAPEPAQEERALHAALAAEPVAGWVVTVVAGRGVAAMAAAAQDARSSLRAAAALRPGGGVAAHAEVAVVGALLGDRERAVRLTRAVLGPLAEPTPRTVDLVDTLEAYFACGERKAGAAARLGVHEKTVAHRLRRIEELLGAPVGDRRAALETAVVLHRVVVRGG